MGTNDGEEIVLLSSPLQHSCCYVTGETQSLHNLEYEFPSVIRHVKESEEVLNQWINCYASNAGTSYDSQKGRQTDGQCHNWDSKAVVVGGVTTTQGERESRSHGEGL
jgi:hypothetical protein